MTQQDWIKKANTVHNNFYDYSEVLYTNSKNKVTIICPLHGKFTQIANSHLLGFGCVNCAYVKKAKSTQEKRNKNFMSLLKAKKHTFDYSKTFFVDSKTPVIVTCPIHGDISYMPNALLHKNCKGCVKCSKESKIAVNNKLLINKCNIVHNGRYNYSKTNINVPKHKLVTVICPEHGEFYTTLINHSKGSICTYCMNEKRSYRARYNRLCIPATLYLCHFTDLNLFKIGVTVNLKHRFRGEKQKYEIIQSKKYTYEAQAYFVENALLKKYSQYKYKGAKVLNRKGNLELLTVDVSDSFISSVETIENSNAYKNICSK